ncbi:hypothetical protein KAS08_05030 [Candidatus Pacearchaeota archaeon]|nr:hypothetical protein [Candidatus Pacearchaeota archaeon]
MGVHHIHKRKRAHEKLEKFPHNNKYIRGLDKFLIIIAIIGPLVALPQILQIFVLKNASGVSALSWGLYALFNLPWITYGFVHKEKPIIIGYMLSFFINLIVLTGALVY